jgi:hypothetical protein
VTFDRHRIATPVTNSIFYAVEDALVPKEVLAAPQGFEPRYADPESAVLPLNEGAVLEMLQPIGTGTLILWFKTSVVNSGC